MADFSLMLFSTEPAFIGRAVAAGVAQIIVDWESKGKAERQQGSDTEINKDTPEDLQRVRSCTDATVVCRTNAYSPTTGEEIERAIELGADEILLPMVRSVSQVESALDLARGGCGVGILVETVEALEIADQLGRLPLSRVYVGLNDLSIERDTPSIFTALIDGTVEGVRQHFTAPFGFGGLTLPDRGHPIPCRLLIGEMVRLACSFSFLRRSFRRDIEGRKLAVEVPRILDALSEARHRTAEQAGRDRRDLEAAVLDLPQAKTRGG